ARAQLLRCNFIMRGVFVPEGAHTVEFRFEPHTKPLYVSLAAIALGVALVGVVVWLESRRVRAGKADISPPPTAPTQPRKGSKS
ncbi:MAG: hypothetical protein NZ739_11835, partial [Verrucomicrobiae bacterium]|nr:hypothetical protein [Verrucomicrobiae bacterium]